MTVPGQTSADLELAVTAAKAAGDILTTYWHDRKALTIDTKRAGDFVSQADLEAELCLRDILLAANPDDGWLGEETGGRQGSGRRWLVDPLDGTTNFLRGIPHWAVSIALEVDGIRCLGVIHDPLKQETFTAVLGRGAFLNGSAIAVSDTTDMTQALFGTGIPFGDMAHIDDHAADIAALMPRCAGVRRMGAAALDLAYVAAGRLDGFWERRLQQWDIAAGLVIMHEAGAVIAALDPADRPERSGTVVAAPRALFDTFAATLRRQAASGNRA
ncbi:inositol monophosphatase family protein [Yoonia vestfoldensis]|uniref:inositol monophosphatase family protein n=1 Tax=Yoonia vestfoldensis TaxID=245188 RepID=UPI000369573D|nr:inositol monophosphatase family protein [Yoonia vestfoldensis]